MSERPNMLIEERGIMKGRTKTVNFDVILESLQYYKMRIQNYPIQNHQLQISEGYPDYAFKQKQLQRVEDAIEGIRALQRQRSSTA